MAKTLNALIYPDRPSVIQDRRMIDRADIPPHKAGWWRPVVVEGDVAFDPATHKKTGPVTTIESNRVLDTWTVTPLTAQEISDRKDAEVNGIGSVLLKIAFNHENRIRANTVPPQSAITFAQFKAAIKALL